MMRGDAGDFGKVYNYLFESMKVILLYAKEGQHDVLFSEEGLIPDIVSLVNHCFL
jgi:hypothetical protein